MTVLAKYVATPLNLYRDQPNMENVLTDFLSLFIAERIVIDDDRAEVWFFKTLRSSQKIDEINSIVFCQNHDHSGGQVLNLIAKGVEVSYFEEQTGFQNFVRTIFKKQNISSSIADALLGKEHEQQYFVWNK